MTNLIIEYFPVFITGIACFFVMLFITELFKKRMRKDVDKVALYSALIDIEIRYKSLRGDKRLEQYPLIKKSLKEIPIVLQSLQISNGFANLKKISVRPINVKSEEYTELKCLIEEIKLAPDDIKELIIYKMSIINWIGRIKHPISETLLKFKWDTLLHILMAVYLLTIVIDKINSIRHKSKESKSVMSDVFPLWNSY